MHYTCVHALNIDRRINFNESLAYAINDHESALSEEWPSHSLSVVIVLPG